VKETKLIRKAHRSGTPDLKKSKHEISISQDTGSANFAISNRNVAAYNNI
jgi:hypothetical protein